MSDPREPLAPPWAYYQRKGLSEMRPYVPGEDLTGISVSEPDAQLLSRYEDTRAVTGHEPRAFDRPGPGGYIARNPENHADQWYVAQAYFDENFEPASIRDEIAELRAENERLRAAIREWAKANRAWRRLFATSRTDGVETMTVGLYDRMSHAEIDLHRLAGNEEDGHE